MTDEITRLQARVKVLEDALQIARTHVANNAQGWSVGRGASRDDLAIVDAALAASQPILSPTPVAFSTVAPGTKCQGATITDRLRHGRVSLAEANAFVAQHHRHHPPVVGHLFSIGAFLGESLVGVVIVGRPVSRHKDDGRTAEVTRLCTDGTKNACSFLYGRAAKAAFALGFKRIGTYTMPVEGGASLRASGWKLVGKTSGKSWSVPSRPRVDRHILGQRDIWERRND